MQQQLVVVCGQTAIGKTDVALNLAQEFNGDIISVDSRQAYKQLTIGSGKDLPAAANFSLVSSITVNGLAYDIGYYSYGSTRIWLYDCATPDQTVNVALIVTLAHWVLDLLKTEKRLPIVIGGDGFYINNLLHPADTLFIPPNPELRNQLESLSIEALQQELQGLNPSKWRLMNNSDQNNPRRLIRAIEVTTAKQYGFSTPYVHRDLRTTVIGLHASLEIMADRIKHRVKKRINQGFKGEVTQLLQDYPNFFSLPAANTLGYKQWQAVMEGNQTEKEAELLWIQAEIAYAKRQKTWFQKQSNIRWFDITANSWYAQARSYVASRIMYGQ